MDTSTHTPSFSGPTSKAAVQVPQSKREGSAAFPSASLPHFWSCIPHASKQTLSVTGGFSISSLRDRSAFGEVSSLQQLWSPHFPRGRGGSVPLLLEQITVPAAGHSCALHLSCAPTTASAATNLCPATQGLALKTGSSSLHVLGQRAGFLPSWHQQLALGDRLQPALASCGWIPGFCRQMLLPKPPPLCVSTSRLALPLPSSTSLWSEASSSCLVVGKCCWRLK